MEFETVFTCQLCNTEHTLRWQSFDVRQLGGKPILFCRGCSDKHPRQIGSIGNVISEPLVPSPNDWILSDAEFILSGKGGE